MSNLLSHRSTVNIDTSRPHPSLVAAAGGKDLVGMQAHAALAEGGLAFAAESRPMAVVRPDGSTVTAPEVKAVVNGTTHAFYGAVGTGYRILQHSAMAQVMEQLGLNATQVVNLKHGQSGLLVASLAQQSIGGDDVRMSLYLQNTHGGVGSFRAGFGVERLFCSNQFAGIFRNGASHPHTANVQEFADTLAGRIDLRRQQFLSEAETFRRMRECPLGREASRWILERTFHAQLQAPIRDKDSGELRARTLDDLPMVANVRQAYADGRAIESEDRSNTVWRMLNAITEAVTHSDSREAKDPLAAARRRLEGILQGTRAAQLDAARTACAQVLAA